MIEKKDIRIVHVEASSRCNSHCPMCSRYTGLGELQPGLVEGDLTLDNFYKLFTPQFTSQLEHVYFSGVYGDPCLNRNLPEMVLYLVKNGCHSVSIDTNGGYRDEEWWQGLAHPQVLINWAIDGTDDETLGKYRIGVVYNKVIKNLKAYVNAGGRAQWNFIVFKHNEHQVDEAKGICKFLGIDFRVKVTQKFRGRKDYKVMKDGVQIDLLEPPVQEKYRHVNIGTETHIPVSYFKFSLENYTHLNANTITCKSQERQEIYLGSNGLLVPCCYLGTYIHDSPGSYQFIREFDLNEFNLTNDSVDNIINKMKHISDRWDKSIENGNLITCLYTCGNKENTTLYYNDKLQKESIRKQ